MENLYTILGIIANLLSIVLSLVAIWHIRMFLRHTVDKTIGNIKETADDAVEDGKKLGEKAKDFIKKI